MDDYRKYCERPVRKKDSVTHSLYDTPWSHDKESDDSDDEEMLPMGEFWPIPEEDWTVVERSHGKPRCTNSSDRGRAQNPGRKLDNSGLCCDELDDIIDTEALLINRNEATRIVDTLPEIETEMETVIVNVKPIVRKRPDGIGAVPIDIADGRDNCPVNVVVTPRGREHQNRGIRTQVGELFPEGLEVIPNEMAEEATMGDLADICEVITSHISAKSPIVASSAISFGITSKTTSMNATTKDDVIVRPAPRQVMVEVLEETKTDENTIAECTYGILDKNETTKQKVSTELLDMSQKLITREFFELAKEARIVRVEKTPSFLMNEVLPQITEITRPMCNSISWKIEEDIEQSVESLCEGTMEVPTIRFDEVDEVA